MAFPKQYGIESLSTVSRILGNIDEEMFRELGKKRAGHFGKGFLRIFSRFQDLRTLKRAGICNDEPENH